MATSSKGPTLVETDIPGVFRNRQGALCDERGVRLSFAKLKAMDDERWAEVLGAPPSTPAELLKGVALDPRMHIDVRLSAAKQAAPYFDMRMPLQLNGDFTNKSAGTLDMAKLASMKRADRESLLKLLKQAGAEV